MKQIDLREGAKRQHRKIALFCVISCWLRDVDGMFLNRDSLGKLIGIQRFKKTRIEWFKEDLQEFFPFFPHVEEVYEDWEDTKLKCIKFSKRKFQEYEPSNEVQQFESWEFMEPLGLFQQLFPDSFTEDSNELEVYISCYLTLLSQGHISPKGILAL